ncbi:MAG: oligosaccharide flippase family protein, partial [Planctomycetes bacterium]|nr:oligosaccharide flippase family protein [Planctomycetota bacterium]
MKNSEGDGDLQMDVYGRSVKGGVWLIGLRGFMFLLNFIRLPILLRLLVPYDFGLLHIGVLMTGMVGSFTNFGLQSARIQRKHNTDTHLNVVWTVGILRGLVLFGILFFAAPYVAIFFDGTGHFTNGDILNDRALVVRLRQGDDLVSEYLAVGFSDSTRRLLDEYDDSAGVSGALSEALVDELNEVVDGPDIYDEDRFAHVELSAYALTLAQQPAERRNTVRSNRRLLDEAFDGLIKRDIMDRGVAALVVQVMAISVLLAGFGNIGTFYFTKELEFNKRVILEISTQLVSTIVTIVLAFVYRNVWALVFGRLAGVVCGLTLSYVMHPYRPRLSFDMSRAKELWGFGKHMFGISILKYFCINGDDLFLGKMLGMTVLGYYQKAFQVGNMVATEIGNKVSMVAFPAYSKLQDNVAKLRSGYF